MKAAAERLGKELKKQQAKNTPIIPPPVSPIPSLMSLKNTAESLGGIIAAKGAVNYQDAPANELKRPDSSPTGNSEIKSKTLSKS
jgi:hypothetical protein